MPEKNTDHPIARINFGLKNIVALQTSRHSPHVSHQSEAPFDNFNLALHVEDNSHQVTRNRSLLSQCFDEKTQIQWLEQVHGNEVVTVSAVSKVPLVADAIVTRQKKIALAIMTADCLPILISDEQGKEIAAIHAGWRPLAANIIAKTLSELSTPTCRLQAWLGPCIGQYAFEVGDEVKEAFMALDANLGVCFTKYHHRWHANLRSIAQYLLKKQGVTNIQSLNECTYQQPERYYSYRRQNKTGRMVSIIAIDS